MKRDRRSKKATCGDRGGRTKAGKPCRRRIRTGHCEHHGDASTIGAKKAAFLAAYAVDGIVTTAARAAGVCRQTHSEWVATDPEYAAAAKVAKEEANDLLRQEARKRAITGTIEVTEEFIKDGKKIRITRKPSDHVLARYLEAELNEFRRRHEHGGAVGVTLSGLLATLGEDDEE